MDNQQPSTNNPKYYQAPKPHHGYIYKYTSPSGKNYIGQTVNSLYQRARGVVNAEGYKKCSLFWRAIQKYGWLNFTFEILSEAPIDQLNKLEQQYIADYNSLAPNGYNLTGGGETGKYREVFVYSAQNGQLKEHYSSLTEASQETGVPIETISAILNSSAESSKKRRQSHNLTFTDYLTDQIDLLSLARDNYHVIHVYDRHGDYHSSHESINEAARQLGIAESSIRKCIEDHSKHASYFQFRDSLQKKISPLPRNSRSSVEVIQIDPQTGEEIARHSSMAAAGRAVGLSSGHGIKRVAERGFGTSGGYFWKFSEGSTTTCSRNPSETARDPNLLGDDIV